MKSFSFFPLIIGRIPYNLSIISNRRIEMKVNYAQFTQGYAYLSGDFGKELAMKKIRPYRRGT